MKEPQDQKDLNKETPIVSNNEVVTLENLPSFEQHRPAALIRKINFMSPSEKDKNILADITCDCFLERYQKHTGISEIGERFKTGFSFLSIEDFAKETEDEKACDNPGVFIIEKHHMFINKDRAKGEPDYDYTTFLHETYHFFSLENGAGFSLDSSMGFSYPEEVDTDEKLAELLSLGSESLCEGTTQALTAEMHQDMGFDFFNNTYVIESEFAKGIRSVVGEETFEKAFFTMPLEEIRLRFESLAVPDDKEIPEDYFNGAFSSFLIDLGGRVKYCNNIISKYSDIDDTSEKDRNEIYAVIDEYLENLHEYIHQND